jgi:hypothetical protein
MPKLHIIYDPTGRLQSRDDYVEKLGIKVAIMSVSENLGPEEIKTTAEQLAAMLLNALSPEKGT